MDLLKIQFFIRIGYIAKAIEQGELRVMCFLCQKRSLYVENTRIS
jgi:hypothetical protein